MWKCCTAIIFPWSIFVLFLSASSCVSNQRTNDAKNTFNKTKGTFYDKYKLTKMWLVVITLGLFIWVRTVCYQHEIVLTFLLSMNHSKDSFSTKQWANLNMFLLHKAEPGGLKSATFRKHAGAQRGWPDVLRSGQGYGFGSQLSRLYFIKHAKPDTCRLSWFPRKSASNQFKGEYAIRLYLYV